MSRHEGVSCDSCLKANFRGKRYKCLICYDYDLCATCYEAAATTTRHTTDHPMQCILTRTDYELYYGGEAVTADQPQSFTCPYCGKMGYTETSLQEHVTTDHAEASTEVVCPICASLPGGDPNHVTDDFAAHLTLEHRAPRDFQDEPFGGIRHVRRIPHPGRGMSSTRARRANMHFQSTGLAPSTRDTTMDPIAELLSQLSSVRSRAAAAQSVSSQLQQLEMQLQSTRYAATTKQQLERLPRRQAEAVTKTNAAPPQATTILDFASAVSSASSSNSNSQYLLSRLGEPELCEMERQSAETDRADRSLFVQELLLSTLAEGLRLEDQSALASLSMPSPVSSTTSSTSESDSDVATPQEASAVAVPPSSSSTAPPLTERVNTSRTPPRTSAPAQAAPAAVKPTGNHRNMVKHRETKHSEKEPPPPPHRGALKH